MAAAGRDCGSVRCMAEKLQFLYERVEILFKSPY